MDAESTAENMSGIILIVDNETDDRLFLKQHLKELTVENAIYELNNGEEAIQYFSGEGPFADRGKYPLPTVVFLDLRMPRVTGLEVLDWLKRNPPAVKPLILAMSDPRTWPEVAQAYRAGAHSFLSKPFNGAELRECLRAHPGYWDYGPVSRAGAEEGAAGSANSQTSG